MDYKRLVLGPFYTNCYIINDNDKTIIIDPADDSEKIIKEVKTVDYIIITHMHWDHVGALSGLKKAFPKAVVCLGRKENSDPNYILEKVGLSRQNEIEIPIINKRLSEGDSVGSFSVLETPGHTIGSISLYSPGYKILFSGDTIFKNGIGRTDLGGNYQDIIESIQKILCLDDNTTILPGHGDKTTIAQEKLNLF